MKLLPYETFTLQTSATLDQVRQRLAAQVEAPKLIRVQWPLVKAKTHAPYTGTVSSDGFEIYRLIQYRNSFLPIIKGQFEALETGTMVRLKMAIHPVVSVFAGVWLAIWYSAWPLIVLSGEFPMPFGLMPLVMPFVMFGIVLAVFRYEVNRSRQELTQIIQGYTL